MLCHMAGMIKKEDIERVRNAADLYDIVSATVALKPSGVGAYVGLCPFHDERTPSFNVRPSVGSWHCFGCGRGGDVFRFVQEQENIDFREAVELLADKYHIELHYENAGGANDSHRGTKRARLLEANEEAQKFFVSQILTEEALPARKLLAGRNFSQQDCARFGCGYAPQGWDNLVRHLADKGFTQQEMLDAGLARQGARGIYDYFRGRATWPIRDSTGRTLGFGARKLYDDDSIAAKYINTPDTQLYHKNQVLYGIDLAKPQIVKKRQVVIVEGYTDVMAMHLAGVDTAVATCGTAFGEEHAKIVRRLISDDSLGGVQLTGPLRVEGEPLSSRIVFTFDGDAAGQKAALHAFGLDSSFQTQTFVAVADNNLDPCDLRIERGDDALRALVVNARPLYDFVIDVAIGKFDTQYGTGQMGAVKAVAPLIARIKDKSLLDLYTRKAARRIGIDLTILQREVQSARRAQHVPNEDAYASRQRGYDRNYEREREQPPMNEARMREIERGNARSQHFHRIDDNAFITEMQFMATLVQIPRAVNAELFKALTVHCFSTPVFQTMFEAVEAAGGLPEPGTSPGQWLHALTKAGGPLLAPVITELAVMNLPLPQNMANGNAAQTGQQEPGSQSAQPMPEASAEQRQYANQLTASLIDTGYMRRIGILRQQASRATNTHDQIRLFGAITEVERERKDLQSQIFGSAAG